MSDERSFALVLDDVFKRHDTGHGHPERAARYDAVSSAVARAGVLERALRIEPRLAAIDEIALCHSEAYIAVARRDIESGLRLLSTGDTDVSAASFEVARLAVGSVIGAVDAVLNGSVETAFCAVRPPGHHARPEQGMGFCVFNNIAIGARYAQRQYGVERVLIADWDVHHGNGTQDVFYDDPSVFFFSTHQSPWYPGTGARGETGEGAAAGTTMNRPFPAGSGREEILSAFRNDLLPAARAFQPDLVMISAGFDSRIGDPLGSFTLEDDDFVDTGLTIAHLMDLFRTRQPRSVSVCALLHKPARSRVEVKVDYLGFTIEDKFVVGYGLDFAERFRNLPYIGMVERS